MESVYNHSDPRQIARVLNQVVSQFDNTGSFVLSASSTSTTIHNPKIKPLTKIFVQPRNSEAATSGYFVASISNGNFTVGHNSATTERMFDYAIFDI